MKLLDVENISFVTLKVSELDSSDVITITDNGGNAICSVSPTHYGKKGKNQRKAK